MIRVLKPGGQRLRPAITDAGTANLILATGSSQFDFLKAFKTDTSVEWSKITVFHLDEYRICPISIRPVSADTCANGSWMKSDRLRYLLEGDARDIEAEIKRYENLLRSHPVDVACIGIGENGHIAFNDPGVADFNDPHLVKVVELDEACRRQQLGEGWFPSFGDVPTHALSLTIPAIMSSRTISCVVPDARKAQAVYDTVNGPVSTLCPASVLRNHNDVILFLDRYSAQKLEGCSPS